MYNIKIEIRHFDLFMFISLQDYLGGILVQVGQPSSGAPALVRETAARSDRRDWFGRFEHDLQRAQLTFRFGRP